MNHYTVPVLNAFLDKQLPVAQEKEIDAHLKNCKSCQEKVKEVQSDDNLLRDVKAAVVEYRKPLPPELDNLISASLTAAFSGLSGTLSPIPNLPPQHPEAPTVPEYSLLEIIGKGGYGTVWLAQDRLGARCAVKILEKDKKHHPGEKEIGGLRLMSISEISHLNLVSVKHVGESKEFWYYVMELVDDTLKNKMDRLEGRPLPPEDTLKIIKELLTVLSECHRQGIAHRDIKPENIGFKKGVLKLIDLGLVTSSGRTDRTLIGTPDYMPVKPSSTPSLDDLYASGMILYTMLTGKSPKDFPKLPADIEANPLFHKLNKIACKACERDPDRRFQAADEFLSTIGVANGKIWKNIKTSVSSARNPKSGRILLADGQGLKTKHKTEETKMNTSVQKIKNAVETMKKYEIQPSERLRKELKNLENPNYKVAVVGKYQVGKSKIINEVFLRNQLLIEGDGLCTTAVATEVCYGKDKKLSLYKWIMNEENMTVEIDGQKVTKKITVKKETDRPENKANPTTEDIRVLTTAKTQQERTRLSDEIQSIKILWPAETLKRYTIFDTPGVDDPNQELLNNTTYRIIPESDVAILVVDCAKLGQVELNFLRSCIFDKGKGLSRIMVLVSYRADKGKRAADSRKEILDEIKSDLEVIGRGHIPVNMICYDSSVEGEILNNSDQIEKVIIDYLDKNVETGRVEKVSMIVLQELYNALKQIGIKLAFAGKSESERKKLLGEIQVKELELKDKYDDIASGICDELMDLKRDIVPTFRDKLLNAMEEYAAGFNSCVDIAAAQDRLDKASILLKPEVEKIVFDIRDKAKEKTKEIVQKYKEKMVSVTNAWNGLIDFDFKIDGGILSRIPSEIIIILDYILTIIILPGGPIINIIERFIAEKIPVIKKFLPGNIIKVIMINCITNAIRGQQNEISRKLNEKFDLAFGNVKVEINKEFERAFTKEVQAIKEIAEKSAVNTLSPEQKSVLLDAKATIESEIRNNV